MKLNPTTVAALELPAGKSEMTVTDDAAPGLALRIRASGTKTWAFQYKVGRDFRRVTLGNAAVISLAKARSSAADLHARVRLGEDPARAKVEERRAAADTLGAALAAYLLYQADRLKPLSLKQVRRHLEKHLRPLHRLQLAKIDRKTVSSRINAISAKSGPVEANRVRSSLQAFFNWAIDEGLADANPAAGSKSRNPEKSRDRVLTDAELKAIWQATDNDRDYSAIIRLLMLSGCRRDEIGGLRWAEFAGDRIELPAERTKNARPHAVPLSALARAILEGRPRGDREYVFGRAKGFSGWSVSKDALDAELGGKVAAWTHHDLRRTAATRMADMGIQPHIIEAVLNHVSGHKAGVAGVYNRATYAPQMQHALDAWAGRLLEIVEGRPKKSSVVPLRASR
jgi:integrase